MAILISIVFSAGFIAIIVGVCIETFEIYPTLSKHKGYRVKAGFFGRRGKKNLAEYYLVCKEYKKPLIYYNYLIYLEKWGVLFIIAFFCLGLLHALLVFL